MNKERSTQELNRFSPTKRLLMELSSGNHNSSSKLYLADSGNGGGGSGDVDDQLERLKKESGVKGSRGSSSNDDGEIGGGCDGGGSDGEEEFRPPPTTITSKKRVRLNGKTSDEYNAMDHAAVPRKLRSAIIKRSSESVSPPLPDVKKKHFHAGNRNGLSCLNGAMKSKRCVVLDPLTKDEEEVVETLFALAKMVPYCKPTVGVIDRRLVAVKSETKTTVSASLSGGVESPNISPVEDSLQEEFKVRAPTQPTSLEQPTIGAGSKNFSLDMKCPAAVDPQRTGLYANLEYHLNLNDPTNPSNFAVIDPAKIALQSAQGKVPPRQEPETDLCLVPSASVENKVQSVKDNTENDLCAFSGKEETPHVESVLPTNEHLTCSPSTRAKLRADPASCDVRHGSMRNDLSTEKLLLGSADRRRPGSRCVTHVYISHLIRNYQIAEKKSSSLLPPSNQLKSTEATKSGVIAVNNTYGLKNCMDNITSSVTNWSVNEKTQHECRIGVLHDRRILPDPIGTNGSGIYSQQKQSGDFLSLSTGFEYSNPGKGAESSGHLPVPYLHPLTSHHPLMPFSIPNGHYSSAYPDQLASQQLQLPHYLGNPFYGLPMTHPGGSSKHHQQQKMWQAHLVSYRPHDSSSPSPSLIPCAQPPSIFPSSPSIETLGGRANHSTNPHNLQFLPLPLFTTPSKEKKHHHHLGSHDDGGIFRPEDSSQLQLVCNGRRM